VLPQFAGFLPVGQSGPELNMHAHDAKACLKYASLAEVKFIYFLKKQFHLDRVFDRFISVT